MGFRSVTGPLFGAVLAWAAVASGAMPQPATVAKPAAPAPEATVEPPTTAKPVVVGDPVEAVEPPTDTMRRLNLTGLQRRVLMQVFHDYTFETSTAGPDDALRVAVAPVAPGGLFRLGATGDLPVRLKVTVFSTGSPAAVQLRYLAQDFYGRKVAAGTLPPVLPDAAGMAVADLVIPGLEVFGYYHVLASAMVGETTATGSCGVAVVHPFEAGPVEASPFGLSAPPGPLAADAAEIARRLGVRHLAFVWTGDETPIDLARQAGLVPAPVVPFNVPQTDPAPEVLAATMGEVIRRLAPRAPNWQVGRRPEFGGEAPAESVASYRGVIRGLAEAVRRHETPAALYASATPEVLVDILTEGPVLAGFDGVALHVDADAAAPNLRSGTYRRSLDYGIQMARRMGVERVVVGGTGDDPSVGPPQRQAWKLVTRHVLSLAAGAERVYATWGRGLPTPLPSATAYAWMTHLLDGARYEGEVWPEVPLLEAHLFSGASRRVAVVWSWAGDNPAEPDRGVLVFDDGLGIEAVDVIGHPVGIWKGERLIVPLGEAPVYLVSGELQASEVRDRLRKAQLVGVRAATVRVESLIRGEVPGKVNVTLWVQSHRPYRQAAVAGLLLPPGWQARQTKRGFALEAGQAREVTFECDVGEDAGPPPYAIEAVVSLDEEYARHAQEVWPAQMPERTIDVGYGLADWDGIAPVVLEDASGDIWAEVRTAWDKAFFYFSAAVRRKRGTFRGGRFAFDGDAIQLAWGLSPRADDDFGHKTRDGTLPAGAFRDTDHLMAITFGKDGAQVVRLRQPRAALRAHVPGNMDPWYGPVEGALADIARDEAIGYTLIEAAIPLKALAPLRAQRGQIFRFGFLIGNGTEPPLAWSREASVPDFLANPASYLPASEAGRLPCQTWWGMTGPRGPRAQP